MVEAQLIPRGINDPRVLGAFRQVPRHKFVPEKLRDSAYDDCALPLGKGQTVSQPYMVAVMTQELGLNGGESVLEVGTGSGYQTAILAKLCKKVYSVERIESLSRHADEILKGEGYTNVETVVGDGTEGFAAAAPYDAIIVTAGCSEIPPPLIEQLKDGGRLVIPLGDNYQQVLTTITKKGGKLESKKSVPCIFVPLVGKFGWKP